jgi:cellulose synthase/poly-beta-1,6-N-acetylglucosamine synthase-like glycosyltransferase
MDFIREGFLYTSLFITLYFQIFLLLTYFGWSRKENYPGFTESELPSVSIMVPCFNEEATVVKTVESLLDLRYPKEKLFIVVIDDGSTDTTWSVVQKFANNPQVQLYQKQNEGSKYAALNYGLDRIHTEIVGCLDADSRVDRDALQYSIVPFSDPEIMAVAPSMIIDQPKTIWQYMQKPEYELGVYLRRVLSKLNALFVTPGPFSIFRRSVFSTIGYYKEAHHTEDLEIALRMQLHGMRIVHVSESLVYTHGPSTWNALLKQRIRWTYGGMKNMMSDYRFMLFSKKFGNLGAMILPLSLVTITIAMISFPLMIWGLLQVVYTKFTELSVTGSVFATPTFDWFFISAQAYGFLMILLLGISGLLIYISRRSLLRSRLLSFDLLTFFIYPFFAAWWTIRSTYSFIRSKKPTWR